MEEEKQKKEEVPGTGGAENPPKKSGEKEAGLEEKLAEAEKQAETFKDLLYRKAAEFENYKKRAARENDMMREAAGADMMLKVLPIVDEFEIALSHMGHAPAKEFKHGMELIYSKLKDLLRTEGVEEMKAEGERFDPYKHDALRQDEGEDGKVIEVVVKGYTMRGKVLRHAKVVVGKAKEGGKDAGG